MAYATVHMPTTTYTFASSSPTSTASSFSPSPNGDYALNPAEDAKAINLIRRINAMPETERGTKAAIDLLVQLDRINLILVSDNTLHRIALWSATGEGE